MPELKLLLLAFTRAARRVVVSRDSLHCAVVLPIIYMYIYIYIYIYRWHLFYSALIPKRYFLFSPRHERKNRKQASTFKRNPEQAPASYSQSLNLNLT
jgi:hypothetical protein